MKLKSFVCQIAEVNFFQKFCWEVNFFRNFEIHIFARLLFFKKHVYEESKFSWLRDQVDQLDSCSLNVQHTSNPKQMENSSIHKWSFLHFSTLCLCSDLERVHLWLDARLSYTSTLFPLQ